MMDLYQRQQVYDLDRLAIELDGQPSAQLMLKAAQAVWRNIQIRWPEIHKIAIFAGPGNNGGDAFALATLALQAGYQVELFSLGDLSRQSDESDLYRQQWQQSGGKTQTWSEQSIDAPLIVDGLLGIGLDKALKDNWLSVIEHINALPAIRVSIDIPSGLNADTGNAMPLAVQADLTVSFIARKQGCFLSDGPDYCGELVFDDLGLSQSALQQIRPACHVLDEATVQLPERRKKNSHKNQFGHVLVIGGGPGMSGAARLAGMAALRSGAGLVSLCVHADNYVIAASQHPELMVSSWNDLAAQLQRASVVVAGPGLGLSDQSRALLENLQGFEKAMVIDADALQAEFITRLQTAKAVLTPHPGEMARLLQCTASDIQLDRIQTLKKCCETWDAVTVLKGSGTLVGCQHDSIHLCHHGHPGMASAGMGDVLAGLLGGYLAQGLNPISAARTAVLIHALAADAYATKQDSNSLVATDIIDFIPTVVKNIRRFQLDLS